MKYILTLGLVIILTGCNELDSSLPISKPDSNVSVIAFDVYKGGVDNGVAVIYLRESASLLIKSNGKVSLDFPEVPPPPPYSLGDDMVESNIQDIKAEIIHIEESTVKEIENLLAAFGPQDLSSLFNPIKTENGVGINVVMVYSDNDILEFTLLNGATVNQRKFLRCIFDEAIEKSRFNKEQLKIFLR